MEGADERPEALINYYAKAQVGVRNITNAIGSFALLWSTVVLLGGFVSVLTIKDFWFLSVMSLVMASKMLQFLGTNSGGIYVAERNILRLSKGLDLGQLEEEDRLGHRMHIFIMYVVKVAKYISMFIVSLIFGCSPYVNIGLSVARLVQRDYGDAGGDAANKAKLNAALIIFYVLVLFHSSYVLYWVILDKYEPWMFVNKELRLEDWGPKFVARYRAVTKAKCHKDGLLPNNWNLITFSVGLLESTSQDDRLWGARVLDTFIGKRIPIRHELLSSSQAIQNLINMIGLAMTDNSEIKERATRIVGDLASELHITQFPDALRCICCLLDKKSPKVSVQNLEHSHHQEDAHLSLEITEQTDRKHLSSGESPKRRSWIQTIYVFLARGKTLGLTRTKWDKYFGDRYHYSYVSKGTKELISQGLAILERLTQDEDNCIEITKHPRLLSKITLPLSYQDFSAGDATIHRFRLEILNRSHTVVNRLISAGPGVDTARLRHDMSCNAVAIRNLVCILEADSKDARELHEQAIEILAVLAFDDSFRKLAFDESTSMTEMFAKTLRRIFLEDRNGNAVVAEEDEEKDKRARRKAGEALARLLLRVPSARGNTDASTSVTNAYVVDLLPKQEMINLLTKVVDQTLLSKAKEAPADVATRAGASSSPPAESQPPNGADTKRSSTWENEEQSEEGKMLAALLSLTVAICNKNVISADDFTRAVPDYAALVNKLKEIVETNMDATTDSWRIQKLVCQVVIAMAQLKPSCIREFCGHNFEQALSKALATMSNVDNCMIFAGDDCEVPATSLTSLVKEAQELLAQEQGDISA